MDDPGEAAAHARDRLAARHAAIIDALPAHVAVLDREGRVLSVSRSWHEFAAVSGIIPPGPIGVSYFEFCATASPDSAPSCPR